MAPDAFDGIGVHEAGFLADELSGVTDGPAIQEIAVAEPFIRKDGAVRIRMPLDERRQRPLAAIGHWEKQTLSRESGHTSDDPLHVNGNGFIPLRRPREILWPDGQGHFTEDAIHPLAGLLINIEPIAEVGATDAGAQTEKLLCLSPLGIGEMASALHGIRTLRECAMAGEAFEAFTAPRILAVADGTTDSAEPAENHPCRHKHDGKKE